MTSPDTWLLPDGIDELLPAQASQFETLHRLMIDRMQSWGYQLVVPPLVEYLDSLLTGTAQSLDLQTFKIIDRLSGRLMGIRADMTPQVARIAAHRLVDAPKPLRLCYIGSVLHTMPEGQTPSRNPIQLGAEIYGHPGPESDVEILCLMVDLLEASGAVDPIALDLGHVGIYRGLAKQAGLQPEQEQTLFATLQRKAVPDLEQLLAQYALAPAHAEMLLALATLNGEPHILDQATLRLAAAPDCVHQALAELRAITDMVQHRLPHIVLNLDLAELRGYHYHTGVVFAAYAADSAQAIALGGRYDDIGQDFGHAQPATGFSLDLKKLVTLRRMEVSVVPQIEAPWLDDASLHAAVRAYREQGHVVVYRFPGQPAQATQELTQHNGHWTVTSKGT